jgi:hypothetical protein
LEGEVLSESNIAAAAAVLGEDIQAVGQPGCGADTKLHYCGILAKRVLKGMAA